MARTGATVTGVDISQELLAAARELSAHVRPAIDFRRADAERLPFADSTFDGVISTFGIMFALDQTQAAAELTRVCCPGGRLALTAWAPVGDRKSTRLNSSHVRISYAVFCLKKKKKQKNKQ